MVDDTRTPGAPPATELVLYQTEDGHSRVQVRLEVGTVWLSQVLMAGLYETTKQNVSQHIQHIFEEGELDPSATGKSVLTGLPEGRRQVRRGVEHYNVSMYLDYAEDQAKRRRQLTMKDWREKLDAFLGFNERDILTNAGSIAMEVAKKLAEDRYDEFHRQRLAARDDDSGDDFDVAAEQVVGKKEPQS